mmetsp:Transcript_23522/g.39430  ORF Transcript_23522/g.39430 Transcript_23522/m.39430 type:complete len:419 (-) Transcript_23522:590-1846(-)|eukprot:CAMPEP_0198206002 /NCGR_PEP_ID=MMETSP1445-20131203/9534_1 /TAXON_ID=36898 /ORGANISM="Pyramimonas sp., Strain CCMP2087" /LENGTH=418 /DNA_ID=CAMNT_0043878519 /DNA_START=140 /DNA_END=1396 /DNA_ORIENTATION=-
MLPSLLDTAAEPRGVRVNKIEQLLNTSFRVFLCSSVLYIANLLKPSPQCRHTRSTRRLLPSSSSDTREGTRLKVFVTGATGKTGRIVVRKLFEREQQFTPAVLVRPEGKQTEEETRANVERYFKRPVETFVGDLTDADTSSLTWALFGCDALVICTSATPFVKLSSLPGTIFKKVVLKNMHARPAFCFDKGNMPEQVDWLGQKLQIDAAKAAGVKHVILLGSIGGTKPEHFLNQIGGAHLLEWKRKAEEYLIASGVPYTIIHAGELLPHPGPSMQRSEGGRRELVVGVDDTVLETMDTRVIPREDVAEVIVQALTTPAATNRSFDLVSKHEGVGEVWDKRLRPLLDSLRGRNCTYSREAYDTNQRSQLNMSGANSPRQVHSPAESFHTAQGENTPLSAFKSPMKAVISPRKAAMSPLT